MKGLAITYVLKIAVTLVFWCIPLLFMGNTIRAELKIEQPIVDYLFLLLGWAYIALCVGYSVGLYQLKKHKQVNLAPIFAGIVSNGGAAILLTFFAIGEQSEMSENLVWFLLLSAFGATVVTLNLSYFVMSRKSYLACQNQ